MAPDSGSKYRAKCIPKKFLEDKVLEVLKNKHFTTEGF
jgi:hypothetical protein